jgi:hypothetical protein
VTSGEKKHKSGIRTAISRRPWVIQLSRFSSHSSLITVFITHHSPLTTASMTPERYEQIGRLYQAALEREPSEHAAFLAEACGTDEALRREVASLLAAHEQASNFIEQPPDDVAAAWQAAPTQLQERSFGHYQMLSPLGKGGMGEVWLAKDTLLKRKVALKLLPVEFTADAERVPRKRAQLPLSTIPTSLPFTRSGK